MEIAFYLSLFIKLHTKLFSCKYKYIIKINKVKAIPLIMP